MACARFFLGPRQVGKSTLLRDQLASPIGAIYQTMDNKELRTQAQKRPNSFLQTEANKSLIIDLRDAEERAAAFDSWIETTCYRDIQQIRGAKISAELALEILSLHPELMF